MDDTGYFHGNFKMTILLLVLSVILFQAPSATTSSTTSPPIFSVTVSSNIFTSSTTKSSTSTTTATPTAASSLSTTLASSPKTLTETTSTPDEALSTPQSTVVTSTSPSTTTFVLTSPTSIATKPPRNPPGGPCAGDDDCVEHAFCENQTECSCADTFFSINYTCQSVDDLTPVDVGVRSYGTTSITVSWTHPSICTATYCKYNVTYGIQTERSNFVLTNTISAMLKDLEADQTYAITVMTLLNDSAGQEVTSPIVSIEQTTMNSQAENLIVDSSSDSALVSFVEPENETNRLFQIVVEGGKDFESCVVLFRNVSSCPGENRTRNCEAVRTNDEKAIAHNITGLLPYSNYTVTVLMVKCEGNTPIESGPAVLHFMTNTSVPGPVTNLTVNTNTSHLCFSWNPPDVNPGPLDYQYEIFDQVRRRTGLPYHTDSKTICLEQIRFFGFWEYAVNVSARTTAGRSRAAAAAEFITNRRDPIAIDLSSKSCCPLWPYTEGSCSAVKPETYSTVYLTWTDQIPELRNTRLTRYVVSDGKGMNATVPITESLTKASDAQYRRSDGTHHCFYAKVPVGTTKSFQVNTYDDEDKVVSRSTIDVSRPIKVPPPWDISKNVKIIKIGSTTITVSFSDRGFFSNNAFGPITDRFLLVKESSLCTFPPNVHRLLQNTSLYWKAGSGLHLVKLTDIADSRYVIGSGDKCEGFCNGELSSGTTYCFAGFVCTIKGCRQSKIFAGTTREGALITVLVSLVCLAMLVGIFVIIGYMLLKYKRSDNRALHLPLTFRSGVDLSKIPREQPIVLSQMAVRVTELHCDSNRLFSAQYEDLVKVSPKHPTNAANLDDNKQKNRYVDVLPFDTSRVTLKMIDNEGTSDYINASFLPGYNWDKEYVACQGPLPGTVDDFWRMIWEQNVSIIVMVTSIKENGKVKCEEYWPVEVQEPKQYGNIVVENISFSSLSTFNVNILKLRIDEDEFKTVKQFHFLNWRDMSADVERNDIISFVRTVRSYMRPDMAGPMVVHCSAGVGRTGTFICLDYIIQFIENHDLQEKIDIYEYVLRLRDNRPRMVQTESQYVFIHDCARQLVEEKQDALDKLSEEERTYENTEMCTVDLEETEDVKSIIYENADLKSTEELVQQTEL